MVYKFEMRFFVPKDIVNWEKYLKKKVLKIAKELEENYTKIDPHFMVTHIWFPPKDKVYFEEEEWAEVPFVFYILSEITTDICMTFSEGTLLSIFATDMETNWTNTSWANLLKSKYNRE